jgi:hypothetical protein
VQGKTARARTTTAQSINDQRWQNLPGKNEETALIFPLPFELSKPLAMVTALPQKLIEIF